MATGTTLVSTRLNARRAMTLCCTAKSDKSPSCGATARSRTAGAVNWTGKEEEKSAVYQNRRRIRGDRGKRLLRQRGELVERSFAHMYDTGGMRRTHLRGHENIIKRLLIHAGAFNMSLIMRKMLGRGTPRGFQGRPNALLILIRRLLVFLFGAARRQRHQLMTQAVTPGENVTPFQIAHVCLNFSAPFLEIHSASGC